MAERCSECGIEIREGSQDGAQCGVGLVDRGFSSSSTYCCRCAQRHGKMVKNDGKDENKHFRGVCTQCIQTRGALRSPRAYVSKGMFSSKCKHCGKPKTDHLGWKDLCAAPPSPRQTQTSASACVALVAAANPTAGRPFKNQPGKWRVFLSHVQGEAKAEAQRLFWELGGGQPGMIWLDVMMGDMGEDAMMEGVRNSDVFLLLLTKSYFQRPFCIKECRMALQTGRRLVLAHTSDTKTLLSSLFQQAAQAELGSIGSVQSIPLIFDDPAFAKVSVDKIRHACGLA